MRPPEVADARALMEIHQDPEVLARGLVTLTSPPGGIEVALRNIDRINRHWTLHGYGQWSVLEKNTGEVIGCVGFFHRDGSSEIELGWIIRRSRWGNGFASEAARGAIDWAWRMCATDHIISLIRRDDALSRRVAEKAGQRFEQQGIEPVSGETRDVFGINRPNLQ